MVPATIHPSAIRLSSMLKVGLGGTQYWGLATACRDYIKLTGKWCGTEHCSYGYSSCKRSRATAIHVVG